MEFKIEICVDSAESAVIAQTAGADRVELCANLAEGGTTPSYGTITAAREILNLRLHVIIRPRSGDFLYSAREFDVMKRDIKFCRDSRVDGIVTGILKPDGSVDVERTSILVKFAQPMTVTFHRAFDLCADPFTGLEDIIRTGASRLLTSGQQNFAPDGAELIKKLVINAGSRIIIMPGGGLDESNIAQIAGITGAKEFHLTARRELDSGMLFRREGIAMGGVPEIPEFMRKEASHRRITSIINILKMI